MTAYHVNKRYIFLRSNPGYLIEQNRTKFQSNLIEQNYSIEFDVFGNLTKSNTEVFASSIMFDFVRKPNKHLRLDYVTRKTDTCNEYKTISFKGTFNRTGNYFIVYFIC